MLITSETKSIQDCEKEKREFSTFDLAAIIFCVILLAYLTTQIQEIIRNHYKNKKEKIETKTVELRYKRMKER